MKTILTLQHSLCLGAILGSLCLATPARAQAILLQSATASQSPAPQIQLSWKSQGAGTLVQIYRRGLGQEGGSAWGNPIVSVMAPINSYTDTGITSGSAYEYQLRCSQNGTDVGYGYLAAGLAVTLVENRGKLLLVVDQTLSAPLAAELIQFEQDLAGDGWTVVRTDSPRMAGASSGVDITGQQNLKAWIVSQYNADPANVKALLLFGRLPIVRSGWSIPDGHFYAPRTADVYYADMHGTWTDTDVNQPTSAGGGTNVPGDGKYDQDTPPNGHVDLQMGRVDLAEMTTWPFSEVELMRNYLRKDHNWRQGLFSTPATGVARSSMEGSGVYSLFGGASVALTATGLAFPQTQTTPFRWATDFGDWNGNNYFYRIYQAMFTTNFGSGKLNWCDSNNAMRDMLCMADYGLTCAWGGRPYWYIHHMGMGATIGCSAYRTQNNFNSGGDYFPIDDGATGADENGYYLGGGVWTNLMGDPTLRMDVVAPPSGLAVVQSGSQANLSWTASSDPQVLGYNVYRASSFLGPFARLNASLLTANSYTDTSSFSPTDWYMVRAVKLQNATTGSYYNASQGTMAKIQNAVSYPIATTAGIGGSILPVNPAVISGSNQTFTITAGTNGTIMDVQVDGVSQGAVASYTFSNVSGPHSISATFKNPVMIIPSIGYLTGTFSPNSGKLLAYGSSQTYTITPASGYVISNVTIDDVPQGPLTGYTFTNVTVNHCIVATCSLLRDFTITTAWGAGGTVSPPGITPVASGSSQACTITPNAGYQIAGVTVDGSSVGAVTSYTFSNITANHTLSASFAPITQVTVKATAGANGIISPSGTSTLQTGTSQTYSITPNSGYNIADVVVDGASVGPVGSYTFSNVTASHTIAASFVSTAVVTLATSVIPSGAGSISPAGPVIWPSGGSAAITALPESGWMFRCWNVSAGVTVSSTATAVTTAKVTQNGAITAVFAADALSSILHSFSGVSSDGLNPMYGSLVLNGTALYGMTSSGGAGGIGTIFQINADGSGYNVIHSFAGGAGDGSYPYGSLVLNGTALYGMTYQGGTSDNGTIFQINADGSGFNVIHSFADGPGDGSYPNGSLVFNGTTLYGMTFEGGTSENGTIFKMNADGSGFNVIHSFAGGAGDGSSPNGSLVLNGTTLYGMTMNGGASDKGTIFKINADGSGYSVIHSFASGSNDGSYPNGSLVLNGTTLYGMTSQGVGGNCSIFKINSDGTGFKVMHSFAGGSGDGSCPNGSLVLNGTTLYGMASQGGPSGNGILFQINADGTGYNVRHLFAGATSDGSNPNGSLLLIGSALYGMTSNGGTYDGGTVFSLPIVPAITTGSSLPTGVTGVAYSQTLQAGYGNPPYSWSVISGALPASLSLDAATGQISGTPTAAGMASFGVKVTDATNASAQQNFTLGISPTYSFWLASNGLPAGGTGTGALTACPAGDGITNLAKYALGINANTPGYQGHFSTGTYTDPGSGSSYLSLTYTLPYPTPSGVTYIPESGANLSAGSFSNASTAPVTSSTNGNLQTFTVRDTAPIGSTPRRFLRLRFTAP